MTETSSSPYLTLLNYSSSSYHPNPNYFTCVFLRRSLVPCVTWQPTTWQCRPCQTLTSTGVSQPFDPPHDHSYQNSTFVFPTIPLHPSQWDSSPGKPYESQLSSYHQVHVSPNCEARTEMVSFRRDGLSTVIIAIILAIITSLLLVLFIAVCCR